MREEAMRLPPLAPQKDDPRVDHSRVSPWVDEQIWGHRLWDSQSPWLLFLEFLSVAEACDRGGELLGDSGCVYPLRFRPRKGLFLRTVVFKDEGASHLARASGGDQGAWDAWRDRAEERAPGALPRRDFGYLQSRFHSFEEFQRVLQLVRSTAVEKERNKRWSSRFVFPFGRSCLYEDLNITSTGKVSREYINFGRTGELLYLMLCRSKHRDDLSPLVQRMLQGDGQWDQLVASLQPDDVDELETSDWRGQSFLPYETHSSFDRLAADWLAVLKLGLPDYDAYPHLVTISALHIVLYQLSIAAAWSDQPQRPSLICEVVAPKRTLIRQLSFNSFSYNDALSVRAVDGYIDRAIGGSDEWKNALRTPGAFVESRAVLKKIAQWGEDYSGPNDPDALLADLRRVAIGRHRRHAGNVHRSYGRGIGLVSRRATNRLRYAPSDALLKTLVMANVEDRMDFSLFLSRLDRRYGLVFGDKEAEQVLPQDDFDQKLFQGNARRLEYRLGSMGLLRRLSDSCAYVINPYGGTVA